jgi:branched-chain amino acid transport system substrate-binding protein
MAGDYAAYGVDISQGAQVAFDEYESATGWEFELVVEDGQGSAEGGAAAATLLASDPGVIAVVGPTFSDECEAGLPIYYAARIPMMSASCTRATLTEGGQDVFNRIPFTDDSQGAFAAAYLYEMLGIKTLAVMHDGGAYGKGLAGTVGIEFTALGGTVVTTEGIVQGELDFTPVLTSIGALSPDAIFFGGYYAEAAVLVSNMEVAGLGDTLFFSDDGIVGEAFIELAGDAAEGVYAGASETPEESAARLAFDAAYEEANGTAAGTLSSYTWHGYDVARAMLSVVEEVAILGTDGNLYVPRNAMVAGVRGLSGFVGFTGVITCNAIGECNALGPTFFLVEDGAWVPAPKNE